MNKRKIVLYSIFTCLFLAGLYLYIWEKPKLEKFVELTIEKSIRDEKAPVDIDIGRVNLSIIPLQLELLDTAVTPKKALKKISSEYVEELPKQLKVEKVAIRPALLDLLIGKRRLSFLEVKGLEASVKLKEFKSDGDPKKPTKINLNKILRSIPVAQVLIHDLKLAISYDNQYQVQTNSFYLNAFNERSSLFVNIKDPSLELKRNSDNDFLSFLVDMQVMITSNSISIAKSKIKSNTPGDNSFVVSSGNLTYKDSFENIQEININTRAESTFTNIDQWVRRFEPDQSLDILKGKVKADIHLEKTISQKNPTANLSVQLNDLEVDDIKLGNIAAEASIPNKETVKVKSINAILPGKNRVSIGNANINLKKSLSFVADLKLHDAQLQSFLKQSTIADIPVWLRVSGAVKCSGTYDKKLNVECPGAITVRQLNIKTASRTINIIKVDKIEIAGSMNISEKAISYSASANIADMTGTSNGVIDFDRGFDINYESSNLDFAKLGPIADLKFVGTAATKGKTTGDSNAATFSMDIETNELEFENYFFGQLSSKLSYKSGSLYLNNLNGNIESTRYSGNLEIQLSKEMILGDIQLPFFRLSDIQQSIIKKVDLEERFKGSGSGRIRLNTPFDSDRMTFILDARLFKGQALGEEYNEADLKVEAVEGILILQKALLQREKTQLSLRGTLDTKLNANIDYQIESGYLQLSTLLKQYQLPVSGEFTAEGSISGKLDSPNIIVKARTKDLIFNKKKYGESIFSFDNSDSQTNIKFILPESLEAVLLFPESNFNQMFLDLEANNFDLAPILGFAVSEEATRSYQITTSGEVSGNFNTQDFWGSEFSSTIKNLNFDYKSNKLETTLPTNIELKDGKLFLNEINLVGTNQYLKVTQPYTEKFRTKFVINSRMNIAFFKIFTPFFEKIDGYSTLRLELGINYKDFRLIGSSYTTDSFIKFPGFPHPVESIKADLLFNQNKILLNSISGNLAGGKLLGNGEISFPSSGKFKIILNTNVENANIHFPEGFKTSGNANISLSGDQPPFLLSGNYDVLSGLIDSDFDQGGGSDSTDLLEELLKKEVSSPLILNIDIQTKNAVEVRNRFVEGYMFGNLKVFDKITAPRIKGEAHFDQNSIVKFRDQEFEVTASSFEFTGQSPINPKLSLRAKTRMNSYDIDLFLQGTANRPVPTMTSQPPLPETQIISMLALGTLPDQFDQANNNTLNNNNNNGNQTGGFEVGTSLIGNNPLGRELKERYDVDVEFSSSFDDQNNTAVPRLTLRRKVTKRLQISVSSTTNSTNQQEGRVTYELNNNLSTVFRVSNQPENIDNSNNTINNTQQNNPFGVDLDYTVEFD